MEATTSNGSFLSSLGWAEPIIGDVLHTHPPLALLLLSATRLRLHAVAMVLSVADGGAICELIERALTIPMRDLVRQIGLPEPRGMRRVLGRLPPTILGREDYQRIAALLAEPQAAGVLHHAPLVTPELLSNLEDLPTSLRVPVVVNAIGQRPNAGKLLMEWVQAVTSRIVDDSAGPLTELIGRSRSFLELRSRLCKIIDGLPALSDIPPPQVGHARRLNTPLEIRKLGQQFQNCLASFHHAEADGTRWVYHWESDTEQAVCEVVRVETMGWFLDDQLGFDNASLAPELAARIRCAFWKVGIASRAAADAFEALYYSSGRSDETATEPHTARNRRGRRD